MENLTYAALFVALLGTTPALAQQAPAATNLDEVLEGFESEETDDLQGIVDGFDSDTAAVAATNTPSPARRKWQLSGLFTLSSAYNYQHSAPAPKQADYRGLSRLRLKLQPQLDLSIAEDWNARINANTFYDVGYAVNGKEQYTDQVLDSYESEAELREAYILGTPVSKLDVRLGRQIVVWGKSDSLRVVDVLNPLDLREPGMVDIEDLRLPVTMARADYYVGNWNIGAIVIPEILFDKTPAYGSDFYPAPTPPVAEDKPSSGFGDAEYALAINGIFSGRDVAFYAASVYDDHAHIAVTPTGPRQQYSRLTMLGGAANMAMGNWLIKGEVAWLDGLAFSFTNETRQRVDAMLGLECSGFTNTMLALEAVNRHLLDYQAVLADVAVENERQLALRYTQTFMRERLEALVLASLYGLTGKDGAFYRASLKYDIQDALALTGGVVIYQSGDNTFFERIARNDRVFVELRYNF